MSNVYTDASHSDAFVDIIHVEDFPLIHRQLDAPNSGRTKRGARLASDEIYVETQWTLKVSTRPPSSSSSPPPYGVCFPDARGRVGMWVISAWGSCCSRADGSSRWVTNAGTQPWNLLSSPELPTPKLPTLLFLAEMLHHNGSNQEEDPRDEPAGQQNNWFHFMIEIKRSYWKWGGDTLWHKIVEARKRRRFLPFKFKQRLKCLRTS